MIGFPSLAWFPKPFGPGDTDGTGAKRMMGSPNVEPSSLLVREMAQNSWDARLAGVVPEFEMRWRTLSEGVRDILKWNVFGGGSSDNLGLAEAFARTSLHAVEVLDRGTKGLGGPTRNDIDAPKHETTDYADFVLTIGAPPEDGYGGGTYGFGKAAAYQASECSTIVIWSRARGADGQLDERFIASAMGSRFNLDGQVFTGRQWWGIEPTDAGAQSMFRVEPARGEDARRLGEAIFERHFEGDETGTSILIISPRGQDADALLAKWGRAMSRNLWPKMDQEQPDEHRMDIRLYRDGMEMPLDSATTSPTLRASGECLAAIRQWSVDPGTAPEDVQVTPLSSLRPKQLLGYIALKRYFGNPKDDERYAANSIIYMRSIAELVVREDTVGPSSEGLMRWVGVFTPVKELDPVFGSSEPPAHDSWNPESLENSSHRTFVRVALKRSKEVAERFRNPVQVDVEASGSASTGKLSNALTGLVASAVGSRPVAESNGRGGRSKGKVNRPSIEILRAEPLTRSQADVAKGRQRTVVEMSLSGSKVPRPVRASSLSLGIDGGSIASEGLVELDRWIYEDGSTSVEREIVVQPGRLIVAEISYPAGLAIDFQFAVGVD